MILKVKQPEHLAVDVNRCHIKRPHNYSSNNIRHTIRSSFTWTPSNIPHNITHQQRQPSGVYTGWTEQPLKINGPRFEIRSSNVEKTHHSSSTKKILPVGDASAIWWGKTLLENLILLSFRSWPKPRLAMNSHYSDMPQAFWTFWISCPFASAVLFLSVY